MTLSSNLLALATRIAAEIKPLKDEIIAARGDRSSLTQRIGTISNFASPNAGGVLVGNYYDNGFQGANHTTIGSAPGRLELAPFFTSSPLRIDRLGVSVSGAGAGTTLRCVIYGCGDDGWPDSPLLVPVDELDCSSTGFKEHTIDFTFESGRQYWLGRHSSGSHTIRSLNATAAVNLGLTTSNGSNYNNMIRRTVTYGDALPDPFNLVEADLAAGNPPSIRFRAAAI